MHVSRSITRTDLCKDLLWGNVETDDAQVDLDKLVCTRQNEESARARGLTFSDFAQAEDDGTFVVVDNFV